jgi:tetraacyldisaccharide 4'-kinase
VLAVDPNGSPREFGDEPVLIAKRLGCPVVVGGDRHEAGVFAEKHYDSAFHLLDDGFQHRSLARDFNIVLLSPDDFRDQLLPAGRLREPISSLRRTDAIVLTEQMDTSLLPAGKFVWRICRSLEIPASSSIRNPIVFCGIARPQKFIAELRAAGIQPVAEKFYRDHHRYTERDVHDLLELRDRHQADGFIGTEKDAVNLGQNCVRLAPIAFPPVKMELLEPADALDTMLRIVAERRAGA